MNKCKCSLPCSPLDPCIYCERDVLKERLAEADLLLSRALDCSDKLCDSCLERIEAHLTHAEPTWSAKEEEHERRNLLLR